MQARYVLWMYVRLIVLMSLSFIFFFPSTLSFSVSSVHDVVLGIGLDCSEIFILSFTALVIITLWIVY